MHAQILCYPLLLSAALLLTQTEPSVLVLFHQALSCACTPLLRVLCLRLAKANLFIPFSNSQSRETSCKQPPTVNQWKLPPPACSYAPEAARGGDAAAVIPSQRPKVPNSQWQLQERGSRAEAWRLGAAHSVWRWGG